MQLNWSLPRSESATLAGAGWSSRRGPQLDEDLEMLE
jgi:hypothetical protein